MLLGHLGVKMSETRYESELAKDNAIAAMLAGGRSIAYIKSDLGCSQSRIERVRKEFHLEKIDPKIVKLELENVELGKQNDVLRESLAECVIRRDAAVNDMRIAESVRDECLLELLETRQIVREVMLSEFKAWCAEKAYALSLRKVSESVTGTVPVKRGRGRPPKAKP